jgi:hypothetical protein
MHLRAQIERILGRHPAKVKVGKLFDRFERQVVTNCDNFATSRFGIRHVMGNHQNGQIIYPRPGKDKLAKLAPQARIEAPEWLVQ